MNDLFLLQSICSGVLLLCYSAVLVRVKLGSNYKKLVNLAGLLLLSNFGTLLMVFA